MEDSFAEILVEIIDTLHKNGNDMWSSDIRSELKLSENNFLLYIARLKEMNYVREAIGKKSLKFRIFLTDEGIELAESEE